MRLGLFVLACALVSLTPVRARADGVSSGDPVIIVGRGTGSTPITTLEFEVHPSSNNGGFFVFDNASGLDWVGLMLTVTFKNAVDAKNALTCESDIFSFNTCSSVRHGTSAIFEFSGGDIPPNTEFFVNLNDDASGNKNGKGDWKTVTVMAITPEPATALLVLSGLAGILLGRKRR